MVDEINPIYIEQIIEDALMHTAVRFFDNDIQQTLSAISQGRRDVCMDFSHSVLLLCIFLISPFYLISFYYILLFELIQIVNFVFDY